MNNREKYKNTKQFWINEITKRMRINSYREEWFSIPDWENKIKSTQTFTELDQIGWKLKKEVISKSYLGVEGLTSESQKSYAEAIEKDLAEIETQLTDLENTKNTFKQLTENYQAGLKKLVKSDDLTDWESQIVKSLADLQKKISDLTTEKDNLAKELKKEQEQNRNHRCNNPDNAGLDQIKERLNQVISERDELSAELKKYKIPLDQEENIDQLTTEELKQQIYQKEAEITRLRSQVAHQGSQEPNNSNWDRWFLGLAVILVVNFLVYWLIYHPKKKKKTALTSAVSFKKTFFANYTY